MSTWCHAVIAKIEVGQDEDDLFNDLEHGAQLFEKAAENASKPTAQKLFAVADSLRSNQPLRARVAPALSKEIHEILHEHPVRELLTRGQNHTVLVERKKAQFSSWYELFPRSTGGGIPMVTPYTARFPLQLRHSNE